MKEIEPKINEIDIIIEEGLKKIVEDKINEQIGSMDFYQIAENLVYNKFGRDIKEISLPKITKKISYEDVLQRLDYTNKRGENTLNRVIENGLENGISKFIDKKITWHWKENKEVKNVVIHEGISSGLLKTFTDKLTKVLKDFIQK